VIQTVNWSGNPNKPVEVMTDGSLQLSPRKSFDLWQETVRGCALPWKPCEIEAVAELRSLIVGIAVQQAELYQQVETELAERKQAEARLRESQHFIHQIAETTPGILYVYDLVEQRNIYVNQQVIQLLGYTAEQVQAMGATLLPTLIHPEDFAQIPAHITQFQAAQDGEVLELEYRMQHANGTWRWFHGREVVFSRTATGLPQQILGICQDISDRKQTEAALLSTMTRFEQAATAVNCLIYEWDLQQGMVERTHGLMELMGYTPEEAEPTVNWWVARIHPDDFAQIDMDGFWTRLATEDRFYNEYRVQHKQGHYLWVEDHSIVVRNSAGQPIKIVGSTTNITSRKQAEAALRESEERYRQLVDLCPDGIIVQMANRLVFANQAALTLFRATAPEELFGKSIFDLVCPAYHDVVRARIEQIRQGQSVPLLEEQFFRLDGTVVDVEVVAIPFVYNGQLAAQVAIRDISERQAALRERKRAEDALRASEARFKLALEATGTIYWERDLSNDQLLLSGNFTNPATSQSISYQEALILVHPEDQDKVQQANEIAIANRSGFNLEHRLREPNDQTWRWVLARGTVLTDAAGNPTGIVGVSVDISDRKQAEQALRESEEHLRYTVELSPQIPWTADSDGRISGFSQRWLALTGLTHKQALGEGWIQVSHPDDRPAMVAAWTHSITTGAPYDIEHRIKLADGPQQFSL
jgi:PAS domain S-box-containing protein